jgi:hypothetical protein
MIFGLPGLLVIGGGMLIAYYLATHVTVQHPSAPGGSKALGSVPGDTPTASTVTAGATNPNPGGLGVTGIPLAADYGSQVVSTITSFQPDTAAGTINRGGP